MAAESVFRGLSLGRYDAAEGAPSASALRPYIPLLACAAVDTPGRVSVLKTIQESRLGVLALRYATSELFELEEEEEVEPTGGGDPAAPGGIDPLSFQDDATEFEACENLLGDGEVRQARLAVKYLRHLRHRWAAGQPPDPEISLFCEPGLLEHLSVLVPVLLIRSPALMAPEDAVRALVNVEAGPSLITTLVCSIPSCLPGAMDVLVQAVSSPSTHRHGVAAVMALVEAAGGETARSIIGALRDVQLGTHLAIRLSIDHGDLPSWAASQVSDSKARRKWLAEAVARSPAAPELGDVSSAFRQALWHSPHKEGGPGMVQSLNVAAMLLASGMRPAREDAASWTATMAVLPRGQELSGDDLLLCVCLLMLLMPSDGANSLPDIGTATLQLLDLRDGSRRPPMATAWVLLQLRLQNWPGIADALRKVTDASLSFPETSFTGLAEAASSAGAMDMKAVAAAVEAALRDSPGGLELSGRASECLKGLLKTDEGRSVAAGAVLDAATRASEPVCAELLELSSGLAAAAMALPAEELRRLLPKIVEALHPSLTQKVGTGAPGAACAPVSALHALEVEEASRKRGPLPPGPLADAVAEWHEAVRKLPLDELSTDMVKAGEVYEHILPRWLQLVASLTPSQTLEPACARKSELLSARYNMSTELTEALHCTGRGGTVHISSSRAKELLASAAEFPLAAIHVLQALQQQQPEATSIDKYAKTAKVVTEEVTPVMLQDNCPLALEEAFVCWWHLLPRGVSQELLPVLLRCLRAPGGRPSPASSAGAAAASKREPPIHLAPVAVLSLPAAAWRLTRVCGMLLAELPRLLAECRGEAELMTAQGVPDALTGEELETALLAQESTVVQILLEAAIAKTTTREDERVQAGLLAERQSVIATALNDLFARKPVLMKLVHFQGYPPKLLPFTVACIPAMHFCGDFLGEMIQSPSERLALFGCQLTGHLASKYRVPWAFAASNSAIARVTQAAAEKRVKFVSGALVALGLMACAFPSLARQVVEVLEECACRKGVSAMSMWTAESRTLVTNAEETYEMILDHLALPGEVMPLPRVAI